MGANLNAQQAALWIPPIPLVDNVLVSSLARQLATSAVLVAPASRVAYRIALRAQLTSPN